jgi:hypothetical protein
MRGPSGASKKFRIALQVLFGFAVTGVWT